MRDEETEPAASSLAVCVFACGVQIHRQPARSRQVGNSSRLFEVIDTPGFIPVHLGKNKGKKLLTASQQKQLQQNLGTSRRQRQLDLGLFFDFTHPHPSPDELALLGAFHMLPHSCLFTIEEAAVALGDAFFRIRQQLPAATDLDRVLARYQLEALASGNGARMGVQLLLSVSPRRKTDGPSVVRRLCGFLLGCTS